MKEVADKVKEISKAEEGSQAVGSDENFQQCDQCDYRCKKLIFLKKHTNSKHKEQICKLCKEKFSSSAELVKHEADKHGNKPNKIPEKLFQQCETPVVCELIGCCWCKYQA